MSTERSGLVSVGIGFIADARDERLAGRHAALQAAGVVGLAEVAALVVVEDLVVGLRARARRRRSKPSPNATPLAAWIEHSAPPMRPSRRSSQLTCEPRPGHEPEGDDLEDAADRLVGLALHG